MPQEGAAPMVPVQLTGANTTKIQYYVGETRGGHNGAGWLLGYFPSSVGAGVAVSRVTGTAFSSADPYAFGTATGGAMEGVVAASVGASQLGWVQTAGPATVTLATQGATLAANIPIAMTDTTASWTVSSATRSAISMPGNHLIGLLHQSHPTGSGTVAIRLVPSLF